MLIVAVAKTLEELLALRDRDHAALICECQPSRSLQHWIDAVVPDRLPDARLIPSASHVRRAILSVCEIYGTPNCVETQPVINDTAALADTAAELICVKHMRLRLSAVTNETRPSFATNGASARRICIYLGAGTRYRHSSRAAAEHQGFTVPRGMPVVLRESGWSDVSLADDSMDRPHGGNQADPCLALVLEPVEDAALTTARSIY